ncbi:hypothetical protein D3C87_1926380 [compost metagenome]
MSRFDSLLLVALGHLGRVLDHLLRLNGILVKVHGVNHIVNDTMLYEKWCADRLNRKFCLEKVT